MATTVSTATMTVTLATVISLAGEARGSSHSFTIPSVQTVANRLVTVETTEAVVLAMGTVVAAGTFVEGDVRFIQVTNLDDTNHVQLTFRDENSTEFAVKLDAGKFFIYNADNAGGVVDTMIAAGSALTVPSTFADLVDITAIADTAAVDLELFVASV